MDEYDNEEPPCMDTFQEDGLDGEFIVDIGLGLDDMTIIDGFDEVNDPKDISMLIKQRNGVTVDNEPPVEEHEGYNTEYFLDATQVEFQDLDDF